ncbi:purine-nucleoside phosphorylase [Catalinimonas alkaloidigena]|uniref:Purine nucleoside phosphorylase n=1 Tax=Catalinimonas alkaloidigena TaxID=1075417 RepID=A0A1G9N4M3_9BACT|nr:purine-nucleoside phosphorylase [Catalinimonas alkaloidigena]SDL81482.1 purine-nucleoside phosphorylase [Catalinimonas alkaloidigena]
MQPELAAAVEYIRQHTAHVPAVGIILGTGLTHLADDIEISTTIPYEQIPHFPVSTVETHTGRLLFGHLAGKPVVAMQGRFHYYEGYSMPQVTFPVRVMKLLGIRVLLISNAAGGLHPDHELSDLMVISDHINLQPDNPLRGPNDTTLGVRFPDMLDAYDQDLRKLAHRVAHEEGFPLQEGVYVSVPGPNLETPAEYRFLRTIGADAVGMSTVPEVIVARHMDLPVLAVSVITDLCAPGKLKKISIAEVLQAARDAEPKLRTLFRRMVGAMT